jgi:DNA-binding transcriptional LysR family regulator
MKSLDLNLLVLLDALLGEESVTRAARRLHLSAPAMSHALARVRDALGDPVLVRAGRAMVPTPRAVALREPVRRMLEEARAWLTSGAPARLDTLTRDFVVRAPDGIPIVYGAALIAALNAKLPCASLRFVPESDSDAGALREARIDLDIGASPEGIPELLSEPLFTQSWVGAVRRGHPLVPRSGRIIERGRLSAARYTAGRHVGLTQRGRAREPVDVALERLGLQRTLALVVPGAYAALVSASRSDLVATVPARVARAVAKPLALKVFTLPLRVPSTLVVQAWHPRFDADPAHRHLRTVVRQVLGAELHPTTKLNA